MNDRTQIVVYGISLGVLAVLLKVLEYRFMVYDHALELFIGVVALLFMMVGTWFGMKFRSRRRAMLPAASGAVPFLVSQELLREFGISKREYEVLELIAQGCSTKEIADRLFVSRNTVKTHASSLFQKLDARRRTQAVQKAKSMGLLP
jgi:DNA-binding CsgD family transcriptional regulator